MSNEDAQRRYTAALAAGMQADTELDAARADMRAAGLANDGELHAQIVEDAIAQSDLGDDAKYVKKMRAAQRIAMQITEAVANGMDPNEAIMLAELGLDPRKAPLINKPGGDWIV